MNIEVVLAYAQHQYRIELSIKPGTTIREVAVQAFEAGLVGAESVDVDPRRAVLGNYGLVEADDYQVCEGDRVEIYRPLLQDPKEWRRQRATAAKQQRHAKN